MFFAMEGAFSQSIIRGKVTDGESGEVLLGATVRMLQEGQMKGGAYTDLEGSYSINAPAPGDYKLIISYVSYINDTLDVTAVADQVVFNETLLFQTMQVREDLQVTIVAKRSQASEVTLYNTKRNSINAIDGITLDLVKRTGDPDVAAAMQRVPGVTVEGGKYIYVRGLGDRYSKTTLNGAQIPGLDPNRNTVQMDIFPSNLIDNILVYKNFTPDLPGDFSGGLVDVRTKDFPDKFLFNASASWGVNTQANFQDNFLTYETGDTDWLGFDDGTRELPGIIDEFTGFDLGTVSPGFDDNSPGLPLKSEMLQLILGLGSADEGEAAAIQNTVDRYDAAARAFRTAMFLRTEERATLNQSYQISVGNQFRLFRKPLGFILGLSYRNSYNHYDGGITNRYSNTSNALSNPPTITPTLNLEQGGSDAASGQNVLWGGLLKVSYKPSANHKFGVNLMQNQNGESVTRLLNGPRPKDSFSWIFTNQVLGYTERSLRSIQVQGDHRFGKLKADWIYSNTRSQQDEPDLRFLAFHEDVEDDGSSVFDIDIAAYTRPARFYRELDETNEDLKVNFELPLKQWQGLEGKIKFGGAYTTKDREFTEVLYEYFLNRSLVRRDFGLTGDLSAIFQDSVLRYDAVPLFPGSSFFTEDAGHVLQDNSNEENQYTGDQSVLGVYAMIELPLSEKLRFVGGIRYEDTDSETISQDTTLEIGILDNQDWLPSANLIYALRENMNLRLGYSRTLARPTFREFAPFASFDFIGDFILNGNPGLDRTLIDNYDVRFEWFPDFNEIISISAFYKDFTNPIEKVILPTGGSDIQLQFRNVPKAEALGLEFEFKKNLGFLGEFFQNFQVGGNVSLIRSRVDRDSAEFIRVESGFTDPEERRQLFGQSPYAINAELAYIDRVKGWEGSLSINVFGERISAVGGNFPDVKEQPRPLLNFSLAKQFGRFKVRLRANNLLNPKFEQTQLYEQTLLDGTKISDEYIYQSYRVGSSFSVGVSYSLD